VFRKKGVEVLLLFDRVDDWVVVHLDVFEGKSLQSVASGALDLGELEDEEQKSRLEELERGFEPVVNRVKDVLGERVKDVRMTGRLTNSPACLVTEEGDLSTNMRRVLRSSGQEVG